VVEISPVQQRISIPIVYQYLKDDTKDVKRLKKAIHIAIVKGIVKCLRATIELARMIVPESDPERYPPSYYSEQLMESYIYYLQGEIMRIKSGSNMLRRAYFIKAYDWKAHTSYAEWVNEMKNVRWSKPTSQTNFMEKLCEFLHLYLDKFVQAELDKLDEGLALLYEVV